MLKLIPQESPSTKKQKKASPLSLVPTLQHQLRQEIKADRRIVQSTCFKLVRYVKKAGSSSLREMGELIHSLQKSALSIEKKRLNLLRLQQKKK